MQYAFFPGHVVRVKKGLIFEHEGIIGYGGQVLHNSPNRGVVASSFQEFSNGQPVEPSKRYSPRYSAEQVVQRAYARLGQRWSLLYNCQHFVSEVVGQGPAPQSHQLEAIKPLAAILLFVALVKV